MIRCLGRKPRRENYLDPQGKYWPSRPGLGLIKDIVILFDYQAIAVNENPSPNYALVLWEWCYIPLCFEVTGPFFKKNKEGGKMKNCEG